jgi:hypothetical protein
VFIVVFAVGSINCFSCGDKRGSSRPWWAIFLITSLRDFEDGASQFELSPTSLWRALMNHGYHIEPPCPTIGAIDEASGGVCIAATIQFSFRLLFLPVWSALILLQIYQLLLILRSTLISMACS